MVSIPNIMPKLCALNAHAVLRAPEEGPMESLADLVACVTESCARRCNGDLVCSHRAGIGCQGDFSPGRERRGDDGHLGRNLSSTAATCETRVGAGGPSTITDTCADSDASAATRSPHERGT